MSLNKRPLRKRPARHGINAQRVAGQDGKDPHEAERKLVEDIGLFRSNPRERSVDDLLKLHRQEKTGKASYERPLARSSSRESNTDNQLVIDMGKKLAASVERARTLQHKVNDLEQTVKHLNMQLEALTKQSAEDDLQAARSVYEHQMERDAYMKQVIEMEEFLADHGLVWIGYRANSIATPTEEQGSSTDETKPRAGPEAASKVDPSSEIYFEMDTMTAAVQDLNRLAGDGRMNVETSNKIAKFHSHPRQKLTFFKNGFFFKNGPFRPYSLKIARVFIKDILEGYFPFELKDEYPDGVVFELLDRACELYSSTMTNPHKETTQPNALRNLPDHTIANGQVVKVKGDLQTFLGSQDGSSKTVVLKRIVWDAN